MLLSKEEYEHYQRLVDGAGKRGQFMHPWYGPCDAFEDNMCSECTRLVKSWRALRLYKFEPHDYSEHYSMLAHSPEEALKMLRNFMKKYCPDELSQWQHATVDNLPAKYELQVHDVGEVILGEWA